METHRRADEDQLAGLDKTFPQTIERAHSAFGASAFRPRGVSINVAVFDAVMVAINECQEADIDAISKGYNNLIQDEYFEKFTSTATANTSNVHGRIDMAIEAISAAA